MEVDMGVLDYLFEQAAGRPVSNDDLKEKAREVAHGVDDLGEFKGSDGWLQRWKKRNHVAIRRGTNEIRKLPEDFGGKVSDFKNAVHTKRREQDYTLANMDETMVRFDMAPKSINNIKGENTVRIATTGGAKKGFTVALTALANGTKLPAYIVFKEGQLARVPQE